jgi:hypothetical protein
LGEKSEGRRSLEKPRPRWDNNIKKDLRQIGRWGVDWIHLAEDRDKWQAVVNVVMNFRVQ